MRMTKALLPKLVASGDGHVVIVGSIAGLEPYPGGAGYNAAKFGARAMTEVLRLELLGQPVRVTEIDPGMVETEFSARPLRRRRGPGRRRSTRASRRSPPTTSPTASPSRPPARATSTSTRMLVLAARPGRRRAIVHRRRPEPARASGSYRPRSASRPTVRPGRSATALTASSTPGMNDDAVVGVVADRQRLAGGAEQHLLVGDQAPQAHRVDADAAGPVAAAGARRRTSVGGRVGRPVRRRRGHALGGRAWPCPTARRPSGRGAAR